MGLGVGQGRGPWKRHLGVSRLLRLGTEREPRAAATTVGPDLNSSSVLRGGGSGSYAPFTSGDGHKGCVYSSWFRLKSMRTRRSSSVSIPSICSHTYEKVKVQSEFSRTKEKKLNRVLKQKKPNRCPAETTVNQPGASAPSPCRFPSSAAAPSRSPSSGPWRPPGRRRTTPGR